MQFRSYGNLSQEGVLSIGLGLSGSGSTVGRLRRGEDGNFHSAMSVELLPLLMRPIGTVGVEPISSHESEWSSSVEVTLRTVEEPDRDILNPLAGLDERLPNRYNDLFGRVKPSVKSMYYVRTVDYKVISETNSELRVQSTVLVKPNPRNQEEIGLEIRGQGEFVVDKTKRLVRNHELKGELRYEQGNSELVVPFEFRYEFVSDEELQLIEAIRNAPVLEPNIEKRFVVDHDRNIIAKLKPEKSDRSSLVEIEGKALAVFTNASQKKLQIVDLENPTQTQDASLDAIAGLEKSSIMIDRDGQYCFSRTEDRKTIALFQLTGDSKINKRGTINSSRDRLSMVVIASKAKLAFTVAERAKEITVWSLESLEQIGTIEGLKETPSRLIVSDQASRLLVQGNRLLTIVDVSTRQKIREEEIGYRAIVKISQDESQVAIYANDRFQLRELSDWSVKQGITLSSRTDGFALSPDGKQVFFWGSGNPIVLSCETGRISTLYLGGSYKVAKLFVPKDHPFLLVETTTRGNEYLLVRRPN